MLFLRLEKSAPAEKFFFTSLTFGCTQTLRGFNDQNCQNLKVLIQPPHSNPSHEISKDFTQVGNGLEFEWRQKSILKKSINELCKELLIQAKEQVQSKYRAKTEQEQSKHRANTKQEQSKNRARTEYSPQSRLRSTPTARNWLLRLSVVN